MTIWDYVDAAVIMALVALMMVRGAWTAQWAVWSLILVHLSYRLIVTHFPEPELSLGFMFMLIAVGYLASAVLSIYGIVSGSLFAVLSMACFLNQMAGLPAPVDQGLGLDLHNVNSTGLHIIAVTIAVGVWRHAAITDHIVRAGR